MNNRHEFRPTPPLPVRESRLTALSNELCPLICLSGARLSQRLRPESHRVVAGGQDLTSADGSLDYLTRPRLHVEAAFSEEVYVTPHVTFYWKMSGMCSRPEHYEGREEWALCRPSGLVKSSGKGWRATNTFSNRAKMSNLDFTVNKITAKS